MIELDEEQAIAIALWRLMEGCTWRRVAELFCEHYPEAAAAMYLRSGNQQCGRELVNAAFDMLGIKEDL